MQTNDKIRIAVLVALSSGRAVAGDVLFDGTTGAAGNAQFNALTNTYSIREQDGTLAGSNLFHSFSTFNIDVTETAEFTATSTVNNVISRVTGLAPTTIDGTVRSLIPNANFWFINPAGITVGATGVIDVQGAFALGSADFVEFQNGQQWHALTTTGGAPAGGLTVNPLDFGFLPGSTAGVLSVRNQNFTATAAGEPQIGGRSWLLTGGGGVEVVSSNSLFLEDGKIETNRGGNVLVAGAGVEFRNTQIYAPRARVGIASVADPSTLVLDDNANFVFADVPRESLRSIRFNDYDPAGVITPFNANIINTSSDSFVGGGVYLLGGEITLRSTLINSDSLQGSPADQAAKGIHVVGESLDINRNTSLTSVVRGDEPFFTSDDDGIQNDSPAEGDGGSITIDLYGDLIVSGTEDQSFANGNNFHTQISSRTFSSGDGGNIRINAANVTLEGPQSLTGPAPTQAELALGGAAAGFIASSNDAVNRDDFASRSAATGNAGDIDITLSGTLRMTGLDWSQGADPTDTNRATIIGVGGAQIASDTQHVGFLDDGLGSPLGTAGDITISARSLEIEGAGQITSSTSGTARGGSIGITLTDGHLSVATDPTATFTSGIFTRASSVVDIPQFGNAGSINIGVTAADPFEGYVTLSGIGQNGLGSRLFSDATFSQGNAGSISVNASGPISLTGASVRTDVANNEDAFAGDVTLRSGSLVTLDSTLVSSQSEAANASGSITVEGTGVLIRNRSQLLADYDNAGSNPGEPGSINITATGNSTETDPRETIDQARVGVVAILDSGANANNNGGRDDADRGNITILGDDIVIAGSVVSTDVVAGGVGDDIVIRGDSSVSLMRSDGPGFALVGTVAAPDDPRDDIQQSLVSARTQASAAAGGLIRIEAGSNGLNVEESNVDTTTSVDGSNANPDRPRSNIALISTGDVRVFASEIATATTDVDPAGNIQISGANVAIDPGTLLQAASSGSGDAGAIDIKADTQGDGSVQIIAAFLRSDAVVAAAAFDPDTGALIRLPNASTISIGAGGGGVNIEDSTLVSNARENAGQAGTVSIDSAGTLSLTGTTIDTQVRTALTVDADGTPLRPAEISLNADGAVSLFSSNLESQTLGAVDAGAISITGSEISVSRTLILAETRDFAATGLNTGNAGSVTLNATAGVVRLPDDSFVSTLSDGLNGGQAGVISITGNGIEMNGATITTEVASTRGGLTPARIDLDSGAAPVSLTNTTLSAATSGAASAGNVTLTGNSVNVSGGTIGTSAESTTTASINLGAAGQISLVAQDITLSGAELRTSTDSDNSTLDPAEIIIDAAGTLDADAAVLRAETTGRASAGNIQVTADHVQMSASTLVAATFGSGDAGSISVAADQVQVETTEFRSDAASGQTIDDQLANAGTVEISAGAGGAVIDFSFLESSAGEFAGQAGTVKVASEGALSMEGNEISTSVATFLRDGPGGVPFEDGAIELLAQEEVLLVATKIESETFGGVDAGNISVSGSEVSISGSEISAATRLRAGGAINRGDAGTVTLTATTGAVRLPDSFVSTLSEGPDGGDAGVIMIRGNGIEAQGATITTAIESLRGFGELSPALIDLNAQAGALSLTDVTLAAGTSGLGDAGNITLAGESIAVSGGSISVTTTSFGNAGSVTIAAQGDVDLIDGASIESSVTNPVPSDLGEAGTITVTGANVTLAGASLSTSTDSTLATSTPAEIVLDAAGLLSLTDTTLTGATTRAASAGDITLSGASISVSGGSITASTTSTGNAGDITIAADTGGDVEITAGADIQTTARDTVASSTNLGEAGTIAVTGQNITFADASLSTSTDSNIVSSSPATILIDAVSTLSLANSDVSADTSGAASAGNITLGGTSIAMNGGSASSSAVGSNSTETTLGAAGTIVLDATNVTLADAGLITTTDSDVTTLTAAEISLDITGALSLMNTDLLASTTGAASAGNITLGGSSIAMNGGSATASSSGATSGAAGTIRVSGADVTLANTSLSTSTGSDITTFTPAAIDLDATGALSVTNTNLSSATSGAAAAGNVTLDGASIAMGGGSISASTTDLGAAGDVRLTATNSVVVTQGGLIETSSKGAHSGEAGTVGITGASITLADADVTTSTEANDTTQTAARIELTTPGTLSLTNSNLSVSTIGATSAGNITLSGASVSMSNGSATASTTAAGNAGEISITAAAGGNVAITSGAEISSSSSGATSGAAGTIRVSGGSVTLADASLSTSIGSDITTFKAAAIDLDATSALSLTDTSLSSATSGAAAAGNITLDGASITMAGGSISASTTDLGDAGDVRLTAVNAVAVTDGASIETTSKGASSGEAGTVGVTGSSIALAGAAMTTSTEANDPTQTAARIDLTTPGALSLTNSTLSAATSGGTSAGNIALTGSSIAMSGGTVTATTTGTGNAGRVTLAATGNVQISNGAVIETSSVGAASGAAGTIDVHGSQVTVANTRVATSVESNVAGLAPAAITLAGTGPVSLTDGTVVDATTRGAAPGGSVVITGSAILADESSVTSQTAGAGDAGSVCLAAGSSACTPDASGRARSFAADIPAAGGVTLSGSTLSTSTTGSGSAGNLDVHASGTLLLLNSTLQSSSSATANAGNGGSINLSSGLSGELLIENSTVQTDAEAAEGGDITVDGGGSELKLKNSVLFASAGANGNGGDVTINNVATTVIDHSLVLAQADRGNGGSILLTLQDGATFLQDSQSLINADSQQGINGEVTINRPNTDLNSSIQPQEVDVSKPAELGTDVCAPATPGARSTFVREGRGGVAESPDSYMTTLPAGAEPERTSATGKPELAAKMAARSSTEQSTGKVARGCN